MSRTTSVIVRIGRISISLFSLVMRTRVPTKTDIPCEFLVRIRWRKRASSFGESKRIAGPFDGLLSDSNTMAIRLSSRFAPLIR